MGGTGTRKSDLIKIARFGIWDKSDGVGRLHMFVVENPDDGSWHGVTLGELAELIKEASND